MDKTQATIFEFPISYIQDEELGWAVIVSKHNGQWVFVKHKHRDTLEPPGGTREPGESIESCAQRELYEETGAIDYQLSSLAGYSIKLPNGSIGKGQLYFADIKAFTELPESEIEKIVLLDDVPNNLTYPNIFPTLLAAALEFCSQK